MSSNHDFATGPASSTSSADTPARPPRPHISTVNSPDPAVSDSRRADRLENVQEGEVLEQPTAPVAQPPQDSPPAAQPDDSTSTASHSHRFNHPSLRHRSQTVQFGDPQVTSPISPTSSRLRHAGTDIFPTLSQQGRQGSGASATGASVYGRPKRSDTVRTYHRPTEVNWEPGAEPGIDTSEEADDGRLHHVHQVGL